MMNDIFVKKVEIKYPIFSVSIKEHNMIKSNLLEMIDRQNKTVLNNKDQYLLSDWYADVGQDREYFTYLKKYIHKYVEKIIVDNSPEDITLNFVYDNVWFLKYEKHHYLNWHNHGGTWALVYFLELSDPNLSTEFFIPFEKDIIKVDVSEGDMLLFPGNIWHRSQLNLSKENKTVIVSNININL